ncbi:unnamed protein product [Peniophora sp. CBMAI 1063]|nr:unnamed protein product [Peniophora sp. CBMAI 1063]
MARFRIVTPILLYIFIPLTLVYTYLAYKLRASRGNKRAGVETALKLETLSGKKLVGFFHPYCNAGGGGERVLWTAIAHIQRTEPSIVNVVYSGDVDATKEEIIAKVKARLDIILDPDTLHFVFLKSRRYIEDASWHRFTLLGQSLGSMYLAWEALSSVIPDLFIDTMGYAFTFHIAASLAGVPVGAYVHYPTISTDMLARVQGRQEGVTNSDAIANSAALSAGKLFYYRVFMWLYSRALRRASFIMANSTWTKNHVDNILKHEDGLFDGVANLAETIAEPFAYAANFWLPKMSEHTPATPQDATRVYPPCDTRTMSGFTLENRERLVVSLAQFRPEKDHATQIRAIDALLQEHPEYKDVRFVLIGGVRNDGDAARVECLKALAKELDVSEHVEFLLNASYPDMLAYLRRASIGLSTMVDEHFGINVVEFMAAGVIPVAHASAGPLLDIVVPVDGEPTGFHAKDVGEFAQALHNALSLSDAEALAMRERGRASAVARFSEEEFEKAWDASGWKKWM